jgi:hypothetical protein
MGGYKKMRDTNFIEYLSYLSPYPITVYEMKSFDADKAWEFIVEAIDCNDALIWRGGSGDNELVSHGQRDPEIFVSYELFENDDGQRMVQLNGRVQLTLKWEEVPKFFSAVYRVHVLNDWSSTVAPVHGWDKPASDEAATPVTLDDEEKAQPTEHFKDSHIFEFEIDEDLTGEDIWLVINTDAPQVNHGHFAFAVKEGANWVQLNEDDSLEHVNGNSYGRIHGEDVEAGEYRLYVHQGEGAAKDAHVGIWAHGENEIEWTGLFGDKDVRSQPAEECGDNSEEENAGDEVIDEEAINDLENSFETTIGYAIKDVEEVVEELKKDPEVTEAGEEIFTAEYKEKHIGKVIQKYRQTLQDLKDGTIKKDTKVLKKLERWMTQITKYYNRVMTRAADVCKKHQKTETYSKVVKMRTRRTKSFTRCVNKTRTVSTRIVTKSKSVRAVRFNMVTKIVTNQWNKMTKFFTVTMPQWGITDPSFEMDSINDAVGGADFLEAIKKFNKWAEEDKVNGNQFVALVERVEKAWVWFRTSCKVAIEKLREQKMFKQIKIVRSFRREVRRAFHKRILKRTFNKWFKKVNIVSKQGMSAAQIAKFRINYTASWEWLFTNLRELQSYNNFNAHQTSEKYWGQMTSRYEQIIAILTKWEEGKASRQDINQCVGKSKQIFEHFKRSFKLMILHFRLSGNSEAFTHIKSVWSEFRLRFWRRGHRRFNWCIKHIDFERIITYHTLKKVATRIANLYERITVSDRKIYVSTGYLEAGSIWGTGAHILERTSIDFMAFVAEIHAWCDAKGNGEAPTKLKLQQINQKLRRLHRYLNQMKKEMDITRQKRTAVADPVVVKKEKKEKKTVEQTFQETTVIIEEVEVVVTKEVESKIQNSSSTTTTTTTSEDGETTSTTETN